MMNLVILKPFDVDIVIILIVFLSIYYSETGAGIFAFGQGLITDIFSGGVLGLFTLIYLFIFLSIRQASRPLDLLSPGGQVVVVFMAVILKEFMMIILLHLFSLEVSLSPMNYLSFFVSAVCTGLIAPFLFYIIQYFCNYYIGENGEI